MICSFSMALGRGKGQPTIAGKAFLLLYVDSEEIDVRPKLV